MNTNNQMYRSAWDRVVASCISTYKELSPQAGCFLELDMSGDNDYPNATKWTCSKEGYKELCPTRSDEELDQYEDREEYLYNCPIYKKHSRN